jgi:hypothetical protein
MCSQKKNKPSLLLDAPATSGVGNRSASYNTNMPVLLLDAPATSGAGSRSTRCKCSQKRTKPLLLLFGPATSVLAIGVPATTETVFQSSVWIMGCHACVI